MGTRYRHGMSIHDGFPESGFLGQGICDGIKAIRAENAAWFDLCDDMNAVLMRVAMTAMENPSAQGMNWSKEAVAVRLLMRSSGSFQGVVLMAERGMVVQAHTLVRSIIEDSFVAGALTTKPDDVIKMLRDGAEASRRYQATFIVAEKLGDSPETRQGLEAAIDKIDGKARFLSPRKVASLSTLLPQYLNYMRLSEDSAHLSATSLHKHVEVRDDGSGWSYRMGPARQEEIEATLHRTTLSVLPVGIVVNQLMPDAANNSALESLSERFRTLPAGATI